MKGLGKTLRGDFGLNVYNSRAVRFWQEQGLSSVTASFELRWQQVRDLGKYANCEALIYGRLPLMITENCVTKNSVGCAHGAGSVLTDRRGEQFPVLCAYGCRCEIENGKTLVLGGQAGGVPVRPAVRTPAVYHRDGGGVRGASPRPQGRDRHRPTTTAHAGCSTGA